MQNLSNVSIIKKLMKRKGFSFSKKLGQNFLINNAIAPKMAEMSIGDNENIGVIEIGPGIGVLSVELAQRAKKVISIEIDKSLRPILNETLKDYDNIEVIYSDVLKLDIKSLIENEFSGMDVIVCANLPYYITTPIIMKLLEEKINLKSITVMVQKEMAQRITAPLKTRASGAITVSIRYYSDPQILFNVSKGSFMPAPAVDSCVIKLDVLKKAPIDVVDEAFLFRVIKASFAMRRKTISNCFSKGLNIDKSIVNETLNDLEISSSLRAENLDLYDFEKITNSLYEYV